MAQTLPKKPAAEQSAHLAEAIRNGQARSEARPPRNRLCRFLHDRI
jgi:hypothetical protein